MNNSIVDEILLLALLIAFIESCAQNTIKTSDHGTFKFILGLLIYEPINNWIIFSVLLAVSAVYCIYKGSN